MKIFFYSVLSVIFITKNLYCSVTTIRSLDSIKDDFVNQHTPKKLTKKEIFEYEILCTEINEGNNSLFYITRQFKENQLNISSHKIKGDDSDQYFLNLSDLKDGAKNNHAYCQFILGKYKLIKARIVRSHDKDLFYSHMYDAYNYFKQASENGFDKAYENYSFFLLAGINHSSDDKKKLIRNPKLGYTYLHKAANFDENNLCKYTLRITQAYCLLNGIGCKKNLSLAKNYIQKAKQSRTTFCAVDTLLLDLKTNPDDPMQYVIDKNSDININKMPYSQMGTTSDKKLPVPSKQQKTIEELEAEILGISDKNEEQTLSKSQRKKLKNKLNTYNAQQGEKDEVKRQQELDALQQQRQKEVEEKLATERDKEERRQQQSERDKLKNQQAKEQELKQLKRKEKKNKLKNKAIQLQEENKKMQAQLNTVNNKNQNILNQLNCEQNKNKKLNKQIKSQESTTKDLIENLSQSHNQIKAIEVEVNRLNQENINVKSKFISLQNENKKTNANYSSLNAEKIKLDKKIHNLYDEVNNLKKDLKFKYEELQRLYELNQNLKDNCENNISDNVKLHDEVNNLKKDLNLKRLESQHLYERNQQLNSLYEITDVANIASVYKEALFITANEELTNENNELIDTNKQLNYKLNGVTTKAKDIFKAFKHYKNKSRKLEEKLKIKDQVHKLQQQAKDVKISEQATEIDELKRQLEIEHNKNK